MVFKAIVICTFALIQCIAAQRNCGCSSQSIAVSDNGGPLNVKAIGPVTPNGIAVATDLGLSGDLDLSGALPYLSAVAFEGQFDTSGSTPLSYSCGNSVAITQEIGNPSGSNAAVGSGSSTVCNCGSPDRFAFF